MYMKEEHAKVIVIISIFKITIVKTCISSFIVSIFLFLFIFSGGATFTIRGQGFNNVGEITVDRVVSKY